MIKNIGDFINTHIYEYRSTEVVNEEGYSTIKGVPSLHSKTDISEMISLLEENDFEEVGVLFATTLREPKETENKENNNTYVDNHDEWTVYSKENGNMVDEVFISTSNRVMRRQKTQAASLKSDWSEDTTELMFNNQAYLANVEHAYNVISFFGYQSKPTTPRLLSAALIAGGMYFGVESGTDSGALLGMATFFTGIISLASTAAPHLSGAIKDLKQDLKADLLVGDKALDYIIK